MMYSNEIVELVAGEIIDRLPDCEGCEIGELAYDMFNNDYYIIGTYRAKEFLKEYFWDMLQMIEQYADEFGETYHALTDVEKTATLLVLMVAQDILGNLESVTENWDGQLNQDIIDLIIDELKPLANY